MSKKLISDLIKISKNVDTIKKFDNGIKWKVEVEGEYKDMSNKNVTLNDLAKTVGGLAKNLENLTKTVEAGFKQVNSRLDNLETDVKQLKTDVNQLKTDVNQLKTDVKEIKSLPTIQKELNKK